MSKHSLSTMTNGHVLVRSVIEGRPVPEVREFCRRGSLVYLVPPAGHKIAMSTDLRAGGTPLMVIGREPLAATIRRALNERDGKRPHTPRPIRRFRRIVISAALVAIAAIGWLSYELTRTIIGIYQGVPT